MAYVPKTFVDHSVEFPNRRKLTAVSGQADTFDIARAEGTVFAEGTKPDAANLNAEFGKIKTETDAINTSLSRFTEYSTDEKIVGKWIDGKPIYRKIFSSQITLTASTYNPIATLSNIDTPIRCFGKITFTNDGGTEERRAIPFNAVFESQYSVGILASGDSRLLITAGGAGARYKNPLVVLEYTKTTD